VKRNAKESNVDKWITPTQSEMAEMRAAERAVDNAVKAERARRQAVRLGLHANVTSDSDTNFFTGFTEDISEGGVFISTFSPPRRGEIVALRISVRGESELVVKGEVRWIRTDEDGSPVGCGVKFSSLDPRQKQILGVMLAQASREPLLFES
jgi:uncharacterized protein (TIGR02266 family)